MSASQSSMVGVAAAYPLPPAPTTTLFLRFSYGASYLGLWVTQYGTEPYQLKP